MPDVKITSTPFERAKPAGEALLKKAQEHYKSRADYANREVGQAAKDAATFLAGQARGRINVTIDAASWERIFGKGRRNA